MRLFSRINTRSFVALRLLRRQLHVVSQHVALGKKGEPFAVIYQVLNNQDTRETETDYRERSHHEFSSIIPENLRNKDLLILKVNQCILDFSKWEQKIVDVIYPGHVLSGIFKLESDIFTPYAGTLVSKVPIPVNVPFESDETIINNRFISQKTVANRGVAKGAKEYYWVIDLQKTTLTLRQYQKNVKFLFSESQSYDLLKSACGQAVFMALTGMSGDPKISPQTAAVQGVFSILGSEENEAISVIRNTIIESSISTPAHLLGEQLLSERRVFDKKSSSINSNGNTR